MQPVLLDHSFFRPSPSFFLPFFLSSPSLHLHFFSSSHSLLLCACSVRLSRSFPPAADSKMLEQQCNKGGSALIKYSNLLSTPFCCGAELLRLMMFCLIHKKPTTSTSEADCDGTPIKWPVRIKMSTFTLQTVLVCLLIFYQYYLF